MKDNAETALKLLHTYTPFSIIAMAQSLWTLCEQGRIWHPLKASWNKKRNEVINAGYDSLPSIHWFAPLRFCEYAYEVACDVKSRIDQRPVSLGHETMLSTNVTVRFQKLQEYFGVRRTLSNHDDDADKTERICRFNNEKVLHAMRERFSFNYFGTFVLATRTDMFFRSVFDVTLMQNEVCSA